MTLPRPRTPADYDSAMNDKGVDRVPGPRVPLIAPKFPAADLLIKDYEAITASNRYTNFGPFERAFRAELEAWVSPDAHAVTFSSATAALQAALLGCVIGAPNRRYVAMPSFTFAAAAQVVIMLGFRPLFVDIEMDGFHADPSAAARAIAEHHRDIAAIVFGNSFGIGCHQIDAWDALASSFDLPLVIDSAAGFGSLYEDETPLGMHGMCEVFSFHATKSLAIGEGGGIITGSAELAQRLRSISNFGFDDTRQPIRIGFNGKLDELSAAIGIRQLEGLRSVIDSHRSVLAMYERSLPMVAFPRNIERSSLSFASVLLPDGTNRDGIVTELSLRGIEARSYYSPSLHTFAQFGPGGAQLEHTELVDRRVLSLPCHAGVTSDVVAEIAETIALETE